MKKILLLFAFLCCPGYRAEAQAYHPLIEQNKYWQEVTLDFSQICNISFAAEFFFNGDSTINGHTYSKLYLHPITQAPGNSPYCPPLVLNASTSYLSSVFLREDTATRKVFVIDIAGNDNLLFDYSLTDGDTINNYSTSYCFSTFLIIDSVRPLSLSSGSITKKFYLNNGDFYVEGITGSRGFFNGFCVMNSDFTLCVTQNGNQLFSQVLTNPYIDGCVGTVGLQHLKAENLSINNFDYHLVISSEMDDLQLIVYDTNGKNCYQSKIAKGENNFALANLSPGCYLVKVFDSEEQKVKLISIFD